MQYLVDTTEGPGFSSSSEAVSVLETSIIPSFDLLVKMQTDKKILAGGVPVGSRSFVFIIAAASNDEADRILRSLPFWGVLHCKVTPLQSFGGRSEIERANVQLGKA